MSYLKPVKCFCGRNPEINTEKKDGMNFSLSCSCGGNEVSVIVRSDNQLKALDLWRHLVTNRLTHVKTTKKPVDSTKALIEDSTSIIDGGFINIGVREDSNPFRQHMRTRFGAHFFGD